MREISFIKMVAAGNDFVVVDRESLQPAVHSSQILARKICDRKYGIGADGLLVLDKSKIADFKMRIFNADGSEAEMCGNGARCCAAYWVKLKLKNKKAQVIGIETKAGIIDSKVSGNNIRIKLTDPEEIKLNLPIKVNSRNIKVNFINTGVPHTVVFVDGLDKTDVTQIGRIIRYHEKFSPRGTNVNFVEVLNNKSIKVRTYERGVEDETLACGTGSVASALIFALKINQRINEVKVHTQSREILTVYFENDADNFKNVWLEGQAKIVFKGGINV